MRALALALLAGCSWTTFDDLADSTWAHSDQKPNIGSTDYAIAIAGASTGTTGGRLAVIGNSVPTYSTLVYDAKGGTSLGPNPQKLGDHFISSLVEQPILVTDGMGRIALVSASVDAGSIAVVTGDADAVADMPFSAPMPPDAAAFLDTTGTLAIAAGTTLWVQANGMQKECAPVDASNTAVSIAALERDATTLWAWTKTGVLLGYSIASVMATCATPPASPQLKPTAGSFTTSAMPGAGARLLIASDATHEAAVLASSSVFVVDVKASPLAQVGTTYTPGDTLASATVLSNNGLYVALGFPTRVVSGKTTGQVEVHRLDPTTGLDTSPMLLNDAQPDNAEVFGRALATLTYNGSNILVVAASNEIFTYYRTTLYDETRQK